MTADTAAAAAVLRAGGLVAFPTETVYGLGADATNARAVRRVYSVKGRPADHPIIVHLATADELDAYAVDVTDAARALARACWPGPLTLVVRLRPGSIASEVTGGRTTVALRVPAHPVALALLAELGRGIAAPSANRFGRVSPTTAEHVRADLGDDVDVVLDGGPAAVGVESTIVDCSRGHPAILRLGGVDAATVDALVGERVEQLTRGEVAAPGTLERHYSPAARVVVVEPGDVAVRATGFLSGGERVGLLAIAPPSDLPAGLEILGAPRDADEYARVLYARLREADERELDVVLVVAPPLRGIGAAVADRLARSAAGGRLP
ncbi:MAG: L-threonylcarbamoyladenylate synthase [Actinomycetota bacterium]|nr:L-threonylcarbamoyladenylate synthase [Actinomycetota bacterium]